MSGHEDHAHEIAHAKTHMHDFEPRIFHLARRGVVTLYDLLYVDVHEEWLEDA